MMGEAEGNEEKEIQEGDGIIQRYLRTPVAQQQRTQITDNDPGTIQKGSVLQRNKSLSNRSGKSAPVVSRRVCQHHMLRCIVWVNVLFR